MKTYLLEKTIGQTESQLCTHQAEKTFWGINIIIMIILLAYYFPADPNIAKKKFIPIYKSVSLWKNESIETTIAHLQEIHVMKKQELNAIYSEYKNFIKVEPPRYLSNYKSPCWAEMHDRKLYTKCLPYFYLAGFPKCGTTDLYFEIKKHPLIKTSHSKEPHWWTRKRYKHENFRRYLSFFYHKTGVDKRKHFFVTGEGSASTFWDNLYSERTPPLIAQEIYHMTPNAKIIIIIRNPTERLYSGYLYFSKYYPYDDTPEDFHIRVKQSIAFLTSCLKTYSENDCVLNRTLLDMNINPTRLYLGMYSVYLKQWLQIFPRHQIHVLKMEEYSLHKRQYLKGVYEFLELDYSSSRDYSTSIINRRKPGDRKKGPMLNSTRQLLNDFYRPFNIQLAEILKDNKYLWTS